MTRQIEIITCQKCGSEDLQYTDRFFIVGNKTNIRCENCQALYSIVYGMHYTLDLLKEELGRKFAKLNKQNGKARQLISSMQEKIKQFENMEAVEN